MDVSHCRPTRDSERGGDQALVREVSDRFGITTYGVYDNIEGRVSLCVRLEGRPSRKSG